MYPLIFGFPSHLGRHRALNRVPWPVQELLVSYLFNNSMDCIVYEVAELDMAEWLLLLLLSIVYICQSQSPNSSQSPHIWIRTHKMQATPVAWPMLTDQNLSQSALYGKLQSRRSNIPESQSSSSAYPWK